MLLELFVLLVIARGFVLDMILRQEASLIIRIIIDIMVPHPIITSRHPPNRQRLHIVINQGRLHVIA